MIRFNSFSGVVREINDFWTRSDDTSGCYKIMRVQNRDGSMVDFVVSPTTYFVEHAMVSEGDMITGYYDADAPVPLIYPAQFRALVMVRNMRNTNVKVDYFDNSLLSSDGMLRLNLSLQTEIVLTNDQAFFNNPANHNLIVLYGPVTRSIPAQTTPFKVVVLCF
jgi:hypothetical protein